MEIKVDSAGIAASGSSAKSIIVQCMTDTDTDNMADISMDTGADYKPDGSIYSDAGHFSDATVYDKNGADKLNADAKTDGEDDGIKDGSDEDSVKDASDKIDASSAKDIEDDDITELEDYEINALLKMITRIQENRKNEEKNIEAESAKLAGTRMQAEALNVSNAIKNSSISDAAKAYIIKNSMPITANSIYLAQHSTIQNGNTNLDRLSTDTWNSISGSADQVIMNAGYDANDTLRDDAKWIVENRIELNEKNLAYKVKLDEISKKLENGEDISDSDDGLIADPYKEVAGNAVNGFKEISYEAVGIAYKMTEEDGTSAAEAGLTLKSLSSAQKAYDDAKKTYEGDETADTSINTDVTAQEITARRQLYEIKLKLTADSGARLLKIGVNPNTDELSAIVEGLKRQEEKYCKNMFAENGVQADSEEINIFSGTRDAINAIKQSGNAGFLGSAYLNRESATLRSISEMAVSDKISADTAARKSQLDTYESVMTKPRQDMGDTMDKAFRNVDSLIKDAGLSVNEANIRAVKILGYTGLPITDENITDMKYYAQKFDNFVNRMTPSVTISMIKNGTNPLNMTVDELSKEADRIAGSSNSDIKSSNDDYARFLVKLENNNQISSDEKNSYIGIYRLINQVSRNDGAAIGAVVNEGGELTLKNLLSAVRTRNRGGIDTKVDDSFSGMDGTVGKNIADQIGMAFKSEESADNSGIGRNGTSEQTEYNKMLANSLLESLTPSVLSEMQAKIKDRENKPGSLYDMNLEELDGMAEEVLSEESDSLADENDMYYAGKVLSIRDTAAGCAQALEYLAESGVDVTAGNIAAAKDSISGNGLFEKLKKMSAFSSDISDIINDNSFIDSLTGSDEMQKKTESFTEKIEQSVNSSYENENIENMDIDLLKSISSGALLMNNMAKNETYDFPYTQGDSTTDVHLVLKHAGKDEPFDDIKLKFTGGRCDGMLVSANMTDAASVAVTIESGASGTFSEINEELSEALEKEGYRLTSLNGSTNGTDSEKKTSEDEYGFLNGRIIKVAGENPAGTADTIAAADTDADNASLYDIARIIIKCVNH